MGAVMTTANGVATTHASLSPTAAVTATPTVAPTPPPSPLLVSATGGSSSSDSMSGGAIAGVCILVAITVVLVALAVRKYREPEPWRKNGNFAKLLTEDDERLARSPPEDNTVGITLRRETDLDLDAAHKRRMSQQSELNMPAPVDGGYLESMGAATEVQATATVVAPAATTQLGRVNTHPTLRKDAFGDRQASQRAAPADALVDFEDELEAVYPVAGANGDELHIVSPETAPAEVSAVSATIAESSVGTSRLKLAGGSVHETRIDAVQLAVSPSAAADSTTDSIALGSSGETSTETDRQLTQTDLSDIDPLNMHHLVKHGLVDKSQAEFKSVEGALSRDGFNRQSQC